MIIFIQNTIYSISFTMANEIKQVPFEEVSKLISTEMIEKNIVDWMSKYCLFHIQNPTSRIDEYCYTTVEFDGYIIEYTVTVPEGFRSYISKMHDNAQVLCKQIQKKN